MKRSSESFRAILDELCIERAAGDQVYATSGTAYIDLFTGNGTTLLGHVDPTVRDAVRAQLERVWIAGALETPVGIEARAAVERFFPSSHKVRGFYSAGAEAAEFALRVARETTGRRGVLGFEGCLHGKSMATAALGWPNELVHLPDFRRLPYVPQCAEKEILERAAHALAEESFAAVFIEPLQGSAGGHLASRAFFTELSELCRRHGTLLVVDEIFTGFHRTGPAFLHQELGLTPDVVLVGKAMGSGFPVSGVVVHEKYAIEASMLPGSTFSGNPLAAAAVVATLRRLREFDVSAKVAAVGNTIQQELAPVQQAGIALRGRGALWVLEVGTAAVDPVMRRIVRGGVIASPTARYIRLLPSATISQERLSRACQVIREACLDVQKDVETR